MTGPIRIVVGEGRTAQQGLLRFVLEGEGFDIVGEARGTADLARLIEEQRPEVVVLDDGIGVMAVSMVHEIAPQAKIVLVWPSAVVPIGGDARVEPAQILRDLGPAVEHVAAAAGRVPSVTETFERPDWIDRIRKDPATQRGKLEDGKRPTKRPSITHLQKRVKRLHPTWRRPKTSEPESSGSDVPAPVVVLPVGTDAEPVLDIGGGPEAAGAEPPEERSEWNRRLGALALSGAAAVSALVLALALGGGRIPVSIVRGGGSLPPGVPGFVSGQTETGPFSSGSLGGSGYDPFAIQEPAGPAPEEEPPVDDGSGGGLLGGDLASPIFGAEDTATEGPGVQDGGNGGGGANGADRGGGNGGGGGRNGGGGGRNGGGGGKGGGGGNGTASSGMPGKSADHNPFGGPPSKLGLTPAHGTGLGTTLQKAANHGKAPAHAHKH